MCYPLPTRSWIGSIPGLSKKASIQIKAGANFLSIEPKKDRVELHFQSGSEHQTLDPPVYKSIPVTKNRVVHFAAIERPEEIDGPLLDWIRASYTLIA